MPTSPPSQPDAISSTLSAAELQRHAFNASPLAIFTITTAHEVTLAEGGLLKSLNLTCDTDRAQFLHTLVGHQQVKQALAGETVTHLASHSGRWLDTTLTPLYDSAGAVIGVSALTVDATDREAAEIRARAYANLVDEAASGAGIGTWEVDFTTNTGNWSPEMSRIWGYPPEARRGIPLAEANERVHPDDRQRTREVGIQALKQGKGYRLSYRIVRPDGTVAHVISTARVAEMRNGRVTRIVGTNQEVTEEYERIAELERVRDELERTQRMAGIGSFRFDLATRYNHWSDEIFRIAGQVRGEFEPTPENRYGIYHPDDRPVTDYIRECGIREEPYTVRYRMIRPDGKTVWVESHGSPEYDASGKAVAYVGTVRDITADVEREDILRQSKARLQEAQSVAHLGHWTWDIATDTHEWSDELYRNLGLEPQAIAPSNQAFGSFVHPDDAPHVEAAFRASLKGQGEYDVHCRILRADGVTRIIRTRAQIERDAAGRAIRMLGIAQDVTESIEAETALRESEARLQEAQAIAHLGHWTWDIPTDTEEWSDELFRILGSEPGAVVPSKHAYDSCIHPDDLPFVNAEFVRALKQGPSFDIRFRILRPDGNVRVIHSTGRVERDGTGRATRMLGVDHDITAVAEQEAELLRIQASMEHAQQLARLGSYEWNSATNELWQSRETYRVFGQDPETSTPSVESFLEVIPTANRRILETNFYNALAGIIPEAPLDITHHITTPDGEERVVRHLSRAVREQGNLIIRGAFMDITESARLTERVQAAARETAAIIAASPLPILLIDDAGSVTLANPAAESTFGWPADEIVGRPIVEFLPGASPGVADANSDASADVYPITHAAAASPLGDLQIGPTQEVRCRRNDGSTFPAQLTMSHAVIDGRNRCIGIVMDITQAKAAEEQLLRMQKSQALGTLVAGVSHDFNNLLTAIQGGIEMASISPGEPQWLDIADQAATRAAELVRQLLRFSRQDEVHTAPVSIAGLLAETRLLLNEVLDRRIWFITPDNLDLPNLTGDAGQLQQVLVNLIVNARDAVLERTETAQGDYIPTISLAARLVTRDGAEGIQITVADNGTGMDDDVLARAFDPFFTTKPTDVGTGLGLATVSGIVQQHNGSIDVDSTPGRGTAVRVWLPLSHIEPSGIHDSGDEHNQPHSPTGGSGPTTRILVVDDEVQIGLLAQRFLGATGANVTVISHGQEAIDLIASGNHTFDLAILDLNMPAPDGWTVLAAMRRHAPGTPVIVASGYAESAEVTAAGARALLPKPYTRRQLLEAVTSTISTPAQ